MQNILKSQNNFEVKKYTVDEFTLTDYKLSITTLYIYIALYCTFAHTRDFKTDPYIKGQLVFCEGTKASNGYVTHFQQILLKKWIPLPGLKCVMYVYQLPMMNLIMYGVYSMYYVNCVV